jgi:hypothetical protein
VFASCEDAFEVVECFTPLGLGLEENAGCRGGFVSSEVGCCEAINTLAEALQSREELASAELLQGLSAERRDGSS